MAKHVKQHLEVNLREPGKAWLLEEGNHPFVIDQLAKHGYQVQDDFHGYDLVLWSSNPDDDVYAYNGEWIVVFSDNTSEVYSHEDFEERYVTS